MLARFLKRERERERERERGALMSAGASLRVPMVANALWLVVSLALGAGETQALECNKTDSAAPVGDNVECVVQNTDPDSTEDISITVTEDITVTGGRKNGIIGHIKETASTQPIDITVTGSTIMTDGQSEGIAHGIRGQHQGSGDIDIDVTDTTITTEGEGLESDGIFGLIPQTSTGDINITAMDTTITTGSRRSHGILGRVQTGGTGSIDIDVTGTTITTESTAVDSSGRTNSRGIVGHIAATAGTGNIFIDAHSGTSITTKGVFSQGLYGHHQGTSGDININATGTTITTESTAVDSNGQTASIGIFGWHQGTGNIDIDAHSGTTITTAGAFSYGLYGDHHGTGGDVHITTHPGTAITTTGPSGHGITAYQRNTTDPGTMDITAGGTIDTSGAGAQGIRVGALSGSNAARVAPFDEDGYRQQTVTVNSAINSAAEGVYMAGGGRVIVGPRGSITSGSGIAILATGDNPGATPTDPAIKPKLRVDLNLGGRRVRQVLGDDWILNDGGETTLAVNRVVLHDGATGNTGRTARNGVWNVRMVDGGGVKVTDRTTNPDPDDWTVSERAENVIADRDFSAADFGEARVRCPSGQIGFPNCRRPPPPMCPAGQVGTPPDCTTPPPPMCPDGQVGTPPNCTTPPPPMCPDGQVGTPPNCAAPPPQIIEEYAPRAALYEALPGFLLRLTGRGPAGAGSRPGRLAFPESPVYVRFSGGGGTSAPARSSVGVDYDFHRVQAELGVNLSSPAPWAHGLTGSLAVRHTQGSTTVTAPTGGGSLDAQGLGVAFGLAYQGAGGAYFNGWGLVSHYTVDVASDTEGWLKRNAGVLAHAFGLETGHRIRLTDETHLTPRVWLVRSDLSMDRFTDAVDSRVALQAAEHLAGGLGLVAATRYVWAEEQTLALRGSVDVEQAFNGRETVVDVSGEALTSDSKNTRVLVGLGGAYQWGRFSVSSEVSVGGLDVSDQEFFGQLTLGLRF